MSKNRYFKELLSLLIRLELGKLFRHFKIGLYKHVNTIGWFENWHPIPRLICGYICGVLLVLYSNCKNTNKNLKSNFMKTIVDMQLDFTNEHCHKFLRLNSREKQLLALLGEGWRPKDIADKLSFSYENIRKQIKGLNGKLELTNSRFNKAAIYSKYAIYFGLI